MMTLICGMTPLASVLRRKTFAVATEAVHAFLDAGSAAVV